MERLCNKLQFDGFVAVEPQGRSGGVALFWKCSGDVKLISMSRYHIDVEVSSNNASTWRLTGLYGEPARAERHKTCELLRNLYRDANLPWKPDYMILIFWGTSTLGKEEETRTIGSKLDSIEF
ncbi:hypothetical protein POM88_033075 [Heracleum sosnowskyi]|uniref:Uncharacterized protein n=1 Tax=Heracleum sosnowskyi TaxID=360622 RepID=A0AAD8I0J0_9APIA|nr:hypothetical protein POM88_033075 [Heracleum sosnowskyi]